jgi:hypothetical protein
MGTPATTKINIGVSNKPAIVGTFNDHLNGINSTIKNRNQAGKIVELLINKLRTGKI